MGLHIRNEETERLVRALAARRGITLTQAVHDSVSNALGGASGSSFTPKTGLRERLKQVQDKAAKYSRTGLKADKEFFDSLSENS